MGGIAEICCDPLGAIRALALGQKFGQTKIEQLYLAAISEENVRGLDVAVNNGFGMGRFQGIRHLEAIFRHALQVDGLPRNTVFEGLPFEKLHDNEALPFELIHVINCADVRMVERRSGPRFPLKSFDGEGFSRELFGQEFQGHVSAKPQILGFIHHSHAATAQLL